jgi:hypothetical protein
MDTPLPPHTVSTEAEMEKVRAQVETELHARLVAFDPDTDLADRALFDDVVSLFRRGLSCERPMLVAPTLIADEWRPRLSLDLTSHRGRLGAGPILFVKRKVLAPAMRWLFEYSQDNFKRQDRFNQALLGCLQVLATDNARLKAQVAALEADRARAGSPDDSSPR